MLKLIAFLWSGCWHKWVILHRISYYEKGRPNMRSHFTYELQCDRCGIVKGVDV